MTNEELEQQFKRCENWQDADQWDWLGAAYFERGYFLNALHCFNRANAARQFMTLFVATETEMA